MAASIDRQRENPHLVFLEVSRKIRAAQLFVKCLECKNRSAMSLKIEKRRLEVNCGCTNRVYSLSGLELKPSTCRGLEWQENGFLQMRLQTSDSPVLAGGLPASGTRRRRRGEELSCTPTEDIEFARKGNLQFHCTNCTSEILKAPSCFSRVLPLPSDNWEELVSDWYCHQPDHFTPTDLKHRLKPKNLDCLIGTSFIVLHPNQISSESVELCQEIVCRTCRIVLGVGETDKKRESLGHEQQRQVVVTSVKLHKHMIYMSAEGQSHGGSIVYQPIRRLEEWLGRHLLVLRSQLHSKFLVCFSDSMQPAFLLWILGEDIDLWLALPESTRKSLESTTGELLIPPSSLGDWKPWKILKVMFLKVLDNRHESLVKEWYASSSVHRLTFAPQVCLNLLLTLAFNSALLPNSHAPNNFRLSYVREERIKEL